MEQGIGELFPASLYGEGQQFRQVMEHDDDEDYQVPAQTRRRTQSLYHITHFHITSTAVINLDLLPLCIAYLLPPRKTLCLLPKPRE